MFLLWPLLRQMPRESVVQLPCNIFRVCVLDTHSLRFVAWRSGVLSHSVKNGKIPVSCDQEKTPLFLSRLSLQCLQDILLDFLSSNSICSALYSSFHVFFFNLDILSWESLSQDTFSYLFSFFGCSCKVRGAAELVIYPKSPLCQVCLSSLPVFVCLFFFSLQLSFCVYLFLHPLCPLCVSVFVFGLSHVYGFKKAMSPKTWDSRFVHDNDSTTHYTECLRSWTMIVMLQENNLHTMILLVDSLLPVPLV